MTGRVGRRRRLATLGWLGGAGLATVTVFLPLTWMLISALKLNREQFAAPFRVLPVEPTLSGFVEALGNPLFVVAIRNSYVVAAGTTLISLTLAALAGYGFSRFRFPESRACLMYSLVTQMFPWTLLVVPYFILARRAGLYDTHVGLVVTNCAFALPFCIWMLRNCFDAIPTELDEAAMVDGCTRLGAILRVILPVSLPGLVATAAFAFLLSWNNFLFALTLTGSPGMQTLPVLIAALVGEYTTQWNQMMALSIIQSVPLVLIFVGFQRRIISGLTAGAVKG